MDIVTNYWMKPIPLRQFDCEAYDGDPDLGCAIGFGSTKQEAIEDLKQQIEPNPDQRVAMNEWEQEPDRKHWVDIDTGLDCLIVRQDRSKHLCGYVGVPAGHPWHGKSYDDCDVDVHGGLTYAAACSGHICHGEERGDTPAHHDVWWLGFDCAHSGDLSPGAYEQFPMMEGYESYKNIAYVEGECASLAAQIKAAA